MQAVSSMQMKKLTSRFGVFPLFIMVSFLMSCSGSLPKGYPRTESFALAKPEETALGRNFSDLEKNHPDNIIAVIKFFLPAIECIDCRYVAEERVSYEIYKKFYNLDPQR